jgi:methylated-DNA-[protein]-cysteine S-methyltransferase
MTRRLWFTEIESPVGPLRLAADDAGLRRIDFLTDFGASPPPSDWIRAEAPLGAVIAQLDEYFAGRRRDFEGPLAPEGTTFQQHVWRRLCEIPYGATISYGELAARVGNPRASRAVGLANGRNPIPIVIPCHRVIGKNGTLVG